MRTSAVHRRRCPGGQGGFTLIELLISFLMIGVIVAIMTGALRLGFQTVERGEKKIDSLERFRSSVSIMDSQIQSHNPLTVDMDGERQFLFEGSRESLQFSTNYSIWGGETGYVVVHYGVETDANGKRFVSVTENMVGMEAARTAVLFNPLDDIYFEYFYKDPTEEEGDWTDTWTDDTTIPEKILVHLVDGARDYSLIIPVRATGNISQPAAGAPRGLFGNREQ